ncbi:alpha/beta fold hydrolase [Cryptosporangium sp. NPDC048952]|uniref:alpha/beta fold hydrolase n=1 Tax=Cryptosporangium sp. NPDC048952 TaxID=3363961 RepID=UPI0037178E48
MENYVSFDGSSLAYRRWGGVRDLPPVVLLHEFGLNHALNWIATGVVDAVIRTGRPVIALDARGHGDSDKPRDPARYGERTMARDLVALIDEMKADAVDVVGYGMGSVVALLAAVQDVRVRRVVAGGVGASVVEIGGVDTRARDPRMLLAALRAPDAEALTDPYAREFRQWVDAVQSDREALAAQLVALHDDPIPLRRITARTLVLAGSEDRLAARPEVLVHAIPKAVGRFVTGDHVSVLGNPEFRQRILEFLQSP